VYPGAVSGRTTATLIIAAATTAAALNLAEVESSLLMHGMVAAANVFAAGTSDEAAAAVYRGLQRCKAACVANAACAALHFVVLAAGATWSLDPTLASRLVVNGVREGNSTWRCVFATQAPVRPHRFLAARTMPSFMATNGEEDTIRQAWPGSRNFALERDVSPSLPFPGLYLLRRAGGTGQCTVRSNLVESCKQRRGGWAWTCTADEWHPGGGDESSHRTDPDRTSLPLSLDDGEEEEQVSCSHVGPGLADDLGFGTPHCVQPCHGPI
jgi:hypothetical protein